MYYRTPKRVLAALAVAAVTASGLAVTIAPAHADAPDPDQVSCTGQIQAIDENGEPAGYLQFGGRYYNTTSDITAASTFRTHLGDRQLVEDLAAAGTSTPYFSPVSGGTGSELTEGSDRYTIMSRSAGTEPGAPPQSVPHTSSWREQGRVEAAVWHFDRVSHRLQPTWINDNDGHPVASPAQVYLYVSSYVFMVADRAGFEGTFGSGIAPGSLKLLTTDPGCTQKTQAITFGTTAPESGYVGQTYDVTATSDSGLDVKLSSGSPDVCSLEKGTVTFLAAGTCTVQADQAGDDEYAAAPQVTQTISVQRIATTVEVAGRDDVVSGQETTVAATVGVPKDAPGAAPAGTVQFSVDGTDLGDPVEVTDGSATSSPFARKAGEHDLAAVFTPKDTTTYTGQTGKGTLGVAKAVTSTVVSVAPKQLTAKVAPTAPGAGVPTGTVVFRVAGEDVGKAELVDGAATLDHAVEPGQERKVSAEYLGDDDMTGSSDSVTRRDPTITSTVTSSAPRSASGWYRTPVRIDYTCTPEGAELTTDCPAADTAGEGAAQSFTRSVSGADGGIGTVTTTVDVDRTAPKVALKGVRAGKRYFAKAPAATCVGSDVLSGLDSCVISTKRGRNGAETMTATATDKAGNVARTRTSYLVVRYAVAGADYVDGAYVIHRGTGINVQAQTAGRPTYRLASSTPARLRSADTRRMLRTGKDTWVYGATVNMPRKPGGIWYLGIQEGRTFTPIKVRMIG